MEQNGIIPLDTQAQPVKKKRTARKSVSQCKKIIKTAVAYRVKNGLYHSQNERALSNSPMKSKVAQILPAPTGKKKRGKYFMASAKVRQRAIELAENVGIKEAAAHLALPPRSIERWLVLGPTGRKEGSGRKILDPIMESTLHKWVLIEQQRTGKLLSGTEIQEMAMSLSDIEGFKASKGWLNKFLNRNNIQIRPSTQSKFQLALNQLMEEKRNQIKHED